MGRVSKRIERLVCAEHCRYYKPWLVEEPDCGSAAELMALAERDTEVLSAIERVAYNAASTRLAKDSVLLHEVCTRCEHYPDHCAYRRPNRSPSAAPCGGLVVMDTLLRRKAISTADLYAGEGRSEQLLA